MDYKEAIEKAIHWRKDHEEIIYPEIMLFLAAVYHNDPDGEKFYEMCNNTKIVTKDTPSLHGLYDKLDEKYAKWIYYGE